MKTVLRDVLVGVVFTALALPGYGGEIHTAIKDGDVAKVTALLKANPKLVEARDASAYGATPLVVAATTGQKEIAELLLANKADIEAQDAGGWTALTKAVANKHPEVVVVLLKHKANVNTAMMIGRTSLHYAVMNDDKPMAKLLLANGANPNLGTSNEYDPPPLHEALNKEMVELLLANKADVDGKDHLGCTALHDAAFFDSKEIAAALIANKADINARNKNGMTPLHRAAIRDSNAVAELLLAKRADATLKDNDGKTALDVAMKHKSKLVAELLRGASKGSPSL